MPKNASSDLTNLLQRLLEKDPRKRLGANGAKEVMDHPWFKNLNWDGLLRKQVKAPIVPFIKNEVDVSNFDRQFTEMPINSTDSNSFKELSTKYDKYEDFTYIDNLWLTNKA